jgi:hypothetical protein
METTGAKAGNLASETELRGNATAVFAFLQLLLLGLLEIYNLYEYIVADVVVVEPQPKSLLGRPPDQ